MTTNNRVAFAKKTALTPENTWKTWKTLLYTLEKTWKTLDHSETLKNTWKTPWKHEKKQEFLIPRWSPLLRTRIEDKVSLKRFPKDKVFRCFGSGTSNGRMETHFDWMKMNIFLWMLWKDWIIFFFVFSCEIWVGGLNPKGFHDFFRWGNFQTPSPAEAQRVLGMGGWTPSFSGGS